MLKVENLSKSYKNKKILNNINLNINAGEIIGIIGENGCGKTTLFKCISLLTSFSEGSILYENKNIQNSKKNFFETLGVFIESPKLYEELSGFQNLKIIARLYKHNNLEKLPNIFNTTSFLHDKVNTYSLGMKQKIGLLRSFINQPKIILLDEPFNALDEESKSNFISFLKEYKKRNNSILITSHDSQMLYDICDKIYIFDNLNLLLKKGNSND